MESYQKPEKMGFFSKLINSMTKSEAYVQLNKESFGRAVIYLLLVSLILGLSAAAKFTYSYNKGVLAVIEQMDSEIPDFEIANGQLNIDSKMPITIKGGSGTEVIYIDTNEKDIEGIARKYNTGIFANRDKMVQKQVNGRTEVTYFSDLRGVTLTKETIINFMGIAKLGAIFIIIGYPICFFAGKFISGLVVAFLAFIANAAFIKSRVKFGDMYKMAFYALTLSMILKTVSLAIGVEIPFFRWNGPGRIDYLYYVLGAVYLTLGLKAIRHHEEVEELD